MRIYLVGYMASGKSQTGRDLAMHLGFEFLDLDEMFEERYRISIMDFFQKYDEAGFRRIESGLLRETGRCENTVISTGGGTPCFYGNMDFILSQGKSVYLKIPVPELVKRLKSIRKKRPLLTGIKEDELEKFIREQLAVREKYYLQATIISQGPDHDLKNMIQILNFPA